MNDDQSLARGGPPQQLRGTVRPREEAIAKARRARATMEVFHMSEWSADFASSDLVQRARADLLDVIATLEAEAGVTIEELGIAGFVPGRLQEAERPADHPDIEALVAADASGWIAACRSLGNPPRVTWDPDADGAALLQVTWTRRALATRPATSALDALLRLLPPGRNGPTGWRARSIRS